MGIWIRSQDKCKLIKCTRFGIDYCSDGICDVIGADCDDVFELGKYKGKEKAIKILDMIQTEIIKSNTKFVSWGNGIGQNIPCVGVQPIFEMPQDEEVYNEIFNNVSNKM